MDQLDDMRIYVAAVELESFTAAANKLGLSKQFVSRRITGLEDYLGARLLLRTTRKLSVTELGRVYYERASRILEDVADANQAVSSHNARPRGTLRVAAPMSFGTMHLRDAVSRFLLQQPEMNIELDLADRLIDIVGEGYDMAVRIGVLSDSSLVARSITPIRVVTCCSPQYLQQRGTPQSIADLKQHDCVLYGHSKTVEWVLLEDGKPCPVQLTGRLRVNNGEVVRDAAIAGLGIALLPTFIVGEALKSGHLVTVLDRYAPAPHAVYAVYPHHRQSSTPVRAFVDFLREHFANAGWG